MKETTQNNNELKDLQREAANMRARRKGRDSTETPRDEHAAGPDERGNQPNEDSVEGPENEIPPPESETTDLHYADQLAVAVKQLEDITREHPVFALLAAFTTGVVLGSLFLRR